MFDKFKQIAELKKMRDEAMELKRQLAAQEVEVEEKDIKVVVRGDQIIKNVVIQGEEQERLVDILNKAIKKSQQQAAKKLQEMSGGLSGLLGK